jgi:hypothetical protein
MARKKKEQKGSPTAPEHSSTPETEPPNELNHPDLLHRWESLLLAAASRSTGTGRSEGTTPKLSTPPPVPDPIPENCCATVLAHDIARSLWHNLPIREGEDESAVREVQRRRLKEVVLRTLVDTPFHYYQGLHEILSVVTLLTPHTEDVEHLSAFCRTFVEVKLAPFCSSSLDYSTALLVGMHCIVKKETGDGLLTNLLEQSGVAPESHYALSWVITWFSHQIEEPALLHSIFEFLLREDHEMGIMALCAAIVLTNETHILQDIFEKKTQCDLEDYGPVFGGMSRLPTLIKDISPVIRLAEKLTLRWRDAARKAVQQALQEKEEMKLKQSTHHMAKGAAIDEGEESPGAPSPGEGDAPEPKPQSDYKIVIGVLALAAFSVASYLHPQ